MALIAYLNNIKLANQLPVDFLWVTVSEFSGDTCEKLSPLLINSIKANTAIPESNLITVKLAASMIWLPSARRHNTEFPANAINARDV